MITASKNLFSRRGTILLGTVAGLDVLGPFRTARAAAPNPMSQSALIIGNPQNVALLGLTRSSSRLVAVGEHGVIVFSDDDGGRWSQAASPVSVTLTAVHFVTAQIGFATGHFGTVLKTTDAGASWTRVLDGVTAAQLAVSGAQQMVAAAPADPQAAAALEEAQRLVAQGPDKPFFDCYFSDPQNGFVIGAYNLIYRTTDGGTTWIAWMRHVPNPHRLHLYAIGGSADGIFVAGEQGLVLKSSDGGRNFQQLVLPYNGSFFTAAVTQQSVVVAGMEGNAFSSDSTAANWLQISDLPPVGLVSAAFDSRGTLWLANQAGQIFYTTAPGQPAAAIPSPPGPPPPPFTCIQPGVTRVFVATFGGIEVFPLNYSTASHDGASYGS